MNAVLNAYHCTKKTLITALAVMPLVLTGTLAHADDRDDDRRPKKSVVKKTKAKKAKYAPTKHTKKVVSTKKHNDNDDDRDDHRERDNDRDDD